MVQEQQQAIAALSMQLARGTGGTAASAGSVTDDGAQLGPQNAKFGLSKLNFENTGIYKLADGSLTS